MTTTNKADNHTLNIHLSDMQKRQLQRIRQHYGFKTNSEVIQALIRKAVVFIDTKK